MGDLDGRYRITSTTNYKGPIERKSDGETEIRNGQTSRIDDSGIQWTSRFKILSETEVEMIATADPHDAKASAALLRPDGSPTLEPVSYHAILKLSRKGDKIQMSGQIHYGDEVVFLTLRKIGD
ncbi:MAG TPA: hypothetical protein VL625_03720 [Patescibacteria group bacterium]|nr:hypothetical protein [Patescibacteria group bacterium]